MEKRDTGSPNFNNCGRLSARGVTPTDNTTGCRVVSRRGFLGAAGGGAALGLLGLGGGSTASAQGLYDVDASPVCLALVERDTPPKTGEGRGHL